MSDYILVTMFAAVPLGLILGRQIAQLILAADEQMEKFGTRELIFIKGE